MHQEFRHQTVKQGIIVPQVKLRKILQLIYVLLALIAQQEVLHLLHAPRVHIHQAREHQPFQTVSHVLQERSVTLLVLAPWQLAALKATIVLRESPLSTPRPIFVKSVICVLLVQAIRKYVCLAPINLREAKQFAIVALL